MIKRAVALCVAVFAFVGCSGGSTGSSSTGGVSAPDAAVGFKAANDTLAGASGMVKNNLSFSTMAELGDDTVHPRGAFGSVWTNAFLPDPRCSGGGGTHCTGSPGSLQTLMGFMTDASAVRDNGSSINIFGRIKGQMTTACAVSSLLSISNGGVMPTTGTFTITFSDATAAILSGYCKMATSDIPASGTTGTVVVTPTTSSTYYDSNLAVTVGGGTFNYLIRVTSSALNISSYENNGNTNFSRTWVALNRTTGVLRAEYASYSSTSPASGEMHRLYFDSVNHIASMIGSTYDYNTPNQYIFSMAGTPGVTTGQTALSITVKGFNIHGADSAAVNANFNSYKGCVTSATGAIATDNTISCAGGVTGSDTSATILTNFSNYLSTLSADGGAALYGASIYGETHTVTFTSATDIFTATFPVQ